MYRYSMILKSRETPMERQLAELAAEAATIKLQIDDVPEVHFIEETASSYVEFPAQINGYCSIDRRYLCICHGLTPKAVVLTTIHEVRHAYQCQGANRRYKQLSDKMLERDAELFVYEFFGTRSNNGDAPTLMRTLNEILQEDSDRLWKHAQALFLAREKLSKPTLDKVANFVPSGTEESDAIRRRFAPVLKAHSEAVRQVIDPNRQGLFPANIEFSSPQPGLKLSYQK